MYPLEQRVSVIEEIMALKIKAASVEKRLSMQTWFIATIRARVLKPNSEANYDNFSRTTAKSLSSCRHIILLERARNSIRDMFSKSGELLKII